MGIIEGSGTATVRVTSLHRNDVTLFKKLDERATVPARAHATDAGFDLSACITEDWTLNPGEQLLVPTGVAVAIPSSAVGLVSPRSGLANQYGITITNAPGIIDSGYRGELKVILKNTGDTAFTIRHGERIAQLVVVPSLVRSTEVDELPEADRGDSGFGSTGT